MIEPFLRYRNKLQAPHAPAMRGRIAELQQTLIREGIDAAWLTYSRDIFYYTGTAQPSVLVITPEDYSLFVRYGIDYALQESFLDKARIIEERRTDILKTFLDERLSCKRIGTQLDVLPVTHYMGLQKALSSYEIVNISPSILEQRKKKDSQEIACIREACRAVHAGYEAVLANLKPGISELELAAAIEYAHRRAGHEGTLFFRLHDFFMSNGPLASGENLLQQSGALLSLTGRGMSAAVPAGPSLRTIRKGDLLIVDIPAQIGGYHADQTRTYALGKASDEARRMFQALLEISNHLVHFIRPGIKASEVYHAALKKAARLGFSDNFLSLGNGRKSHLVGHGVGLECNEPPLLSAADESVIGSGFVLTIELHLLHPSTGAVKLEDMVLVHPNGCEILTTAPRALMEITGDR